MRLAACAVFLATLAGCGYVGPVLPPSPMIPTAITDLAVVERGDKIIVTFAAPARTTDSVPITRFDSIDLRIAPAGKPIEDGKQYEVDVPADGGKEDPQPRPMTYTLPANEWNGQKISVAVRTAVKKTGHFSAWSNRVSAEIVPPLEPPVVASDGSGEGIVLTWAAQEGVQYRVSRQSASDPQPVELGVSKGGRYVDTSAAYGTAYRYVVVAFKASAESLPSDPISYSAVDKYPPAVPTGLTVLAGPDAVGLAWQRNTETDFQGYYIYRSTNNAPYQRLPGLVSLPTYSDHDVEHGKTYSYQLTSVDRTGNESARSSTVEAQF